MSEAETREVERILKASVGRGTQLTVRGDRATVTATSFGSEVDAAAVLQMIGALPDPLVRVIEVRSSTWFAPSDEDVAMLARETGRSVERAV